MGNLMSTLYIGYVKEIIRDTLGVPIFDLRVHVPAIHGFRVSDETKLPIARPLVIPGMTIMQEDLEAIYNDNLIGQRVIVFFESGNKTNPIYLGVIGQKPTISPSPKEEETQTITPDFSSGNVVVIPTSGKVLSQVTINKDANLIEDNIKSGVTIFGEAGGLVEGKPIEVSTAIAMDNLLVSDNVGKVYKFTGTTDANYINGELYEVVSE